MNGPTSISTTVGGSAVIAVPKGTTVYTDAMNISGIDTFGLTYSVNCTGTPNVKVEIEQGIVKPAGNAADSNFVVPENAKPVVSSLTDKNVHHAALMDICCVKFMRLKITELTNTVTDTVATIFWNVQNKMPNL